jgi:hypothetical protein
MNAIFHLHGLGNFHNDLPQKWSLAMTLREDAVSLGSARTRRLKSRSPSGSVYAEAGSGECLHDSQLLLMRWVSSRVATSSRGCTLKRSGVGGLAT